MRVPKKKTGSCNVAEPYPSFSGRKQEVLSKDLTEGEEKTKVLNSANNLVSVRTDAKGW